MSYFQDSEFQCKCGNCPVRPPDARLLEGLEKLRSAYGKPIYITSGWRCVSQNQKAGGVRDSAHLFGKAADLFCTASKDRYQILTHAMGLFDRIGIGTTFIHLDVDENKEQGVVWLYGNH